MRGVTTVPHDESDDPTTKARKKHKKGHITMAHTLPLSLLSNSVVSWSLVSQAGLPQSIKLRLKGASDYVVETTVKSPDLKNFSTGTFELGSAFEVDLVVESAHDNKPPQSRLVDMSQPGSGTIIAKTYLVSWEDGVDNDFRDGFLTLTCYQKKR
jgi:hypothetical protein